MYLLNNNIKTLNEIPDMNIIPNVFELPESVSGYIKLLLI